MPKTGLLTAYMPCRAILSLRLLASHQKFHPQTSAQYTGSPTWVTPGLTAPACCQVPCGNMVLLEPIQVTQDGATEAEAVHLKQPQTAPL
eukprot:CAMPEP_0202894704 /NCGR_PEP_ID=MMETSP1392-20130828/4049_1 /ASSEMBLY_ACC=CAM_ASM_000868 /TAXON_ID=225041 /ORGANISM="Chlamydomonas chlamydogama, Strain SAG 11-48b" /LENGTH=89 /DNA_ID=CAMNT_0049579473 /DNA_START=488 /DNA_END=753 /DNA_ORIENTATION=+